MTRLFIAEKPEMGRKIAEALKGPMKSNKGYIETSEGIVTWCIGHILKAFDPEDYDPKWKDWKVDTLPIIPNEFKLKVEHTKKDQFQTIKKLLSEATEVVNAGDPGREGQLIVDEVLFHLKNKKPVLRILLDALDKKSVRDALNNLRDNKEFYNLFLAAQTRAYSDFIIGINGTRAYTLAGKTKGYHEATLSVGRVQSPTLAIVVRRDLEIENFVAHAYYTINATFSFNNKSFISTWKPNTTTPAESLDSSKRLIDLNLANSIIAKTKDKPATVIDYTEGKGKSSQPLAFNLSKLQIYANAKWGMSAEDVLNTCQSLYQNGFQSYPRTDCQFFKEEHHTEAPIITANIGKSFPHLANAVKGVNFGIKSPVWNTKKITEHYGLMPTHKEVDVSQLNTNEKRIYQTVCERYLAQFYPEHEYNTTNITLACEREIFKVSGRVITIPGWKSIFEEEAVDESEDKDKESEDDNQTLPAMKKGDIANFVNNKKTDKMTKPPARYTEGTLIQAMTNVDTLVTNPAHKAKLKDKKGIGQESTRVSILKTLFDRKYIVKDGKKLISTQIGRVLCDNLPSKFIDPAWTAMLEDALDKIADGLVKVDDFKVKQYEWVDEIIEKSKTTPFANIPQTPSKYGSSSKPQYASSSKSKAAPNKPTGKKCPACSNGELVERVSAKGHKYLACSDYKNCKHFEYIKK